MIVTTAKGKTMSEWTPCSERLPNDGEWCLVSVNVNAIDDIPYEVVISDKVSYCYERGWATAWMPLPKPWKENDNERMDTMQ